MNIAFLNAYLYEPAEDYQKHYSQQMVRYLKSCWPYAQVKTYECGLGDFSYDQNNDLYVIGGSPKSVYEKDPWITTLISRTQELLQQGQRFLGICFGHQVLATALGGKVEKAQNGWEIGVASFDIVDNPGTGQQMQNKTVQMYFSHQDQVVQLPETVRVIGSNSFCPVQAFRFSDQILSFQCHPEFERSFLKSRILARKNQLGLPVHDQAIESLNITPDTDWSIDFIRRFFSFT